MLNEGGDNMKMWKRAFGLAMASVLAVTSLTACGGSGSSEESSSADTFKIGGIGPTTGDAAAYGIAVQNGIQLAVDEINEAGGINGKQIEYKFEDDVSDAEKSVNAYNTLKDWGMQMLVGTVTSNPCTAVVKETSNDNMFQLTPSATAVESIQYENAFRICFSDPNQGKASADYIADNGLATKVAVIYNSSDVYSTGIYQKFAEEAKTKNLDIVAAEAFTADSKNDFSVQIQKAKDSGAELVFLPIYYQEASLILTQANDLGYAPEFFGCDGLDGILDVEGFDTSLAEGVMLLTPFNADATDDKTVAFVEKYKEEYGEVPNQFAADAYDCIYAYAQALEAAGATPDMSNEELCDAMIEQFTSMTFNGLTGENMTWDTTGAVSKSPKGMVIENGAYVGM